MAGPPDSLGRKRFGSSVKRDPFDALIQPIKQDSPRLYEALKRLYDLNEQTISLIQEVGGNIINNLTTTTGVAGKDKATFNLNKKLVAPTDSIIPEYYICRQGGTFVDVVANFFSPPLSDSGAQFTTLDIQLSHDDGGTWASIFPAGPKLTLINGSYATKTVSTFAPPGKIEIGDLLRIACLNVAETFPGRYGSVVLRWPITS